MANKRGNPQMQANGTIGKDTRFKHGQSGNPGGKLAGEVELTPAVKRYLRDHPEKVKAFAQSWVEHALEEVGAREQLLERIEGKVTDKVQVEVSGAVEIVTVEVRLPALDAEQREHRLIGGQT